MMLVEGPGLAERVKSGPMEPREAAGLVRQVALALQYAHERSIIHRDLKPENILLRLDGQPMVTDFGLAKQIDVAENLTQSGQVLGTPGYMAPEQALGRLDLHGPHVDIYSLGAILYCLLTGRPPFQAASTLETLDQVVRQMPVSPRDLNRAVPRDLETICLKCLAKDYRQRYHSAAALADDLDRFSKGMPVTARRTGSLVRLWRWAQRNAAVAALSATVLLSLLIGTVVSTRFAMLADTRAQQAEDSFRKSELHRQAAERFSQLAREAVDKYFTRVSENTLLNQPGMQPLQRELLRDALTYYQQLAAEISDDESSEEELALALFRVGLIEEVVNIRVIEIFCMSRRTMPTGSYPRVGKRALQQDRVPPDACETTAELSGNLMMSTACGRCAFGAVRS